MKKTVLFLALAILSQVFGADVYTGTSTAGSVTFHYSAREKLLYQGGFSGRALFRYEPGEKPRIRRGPSFNGSAAYTFEYSNSWIRMYSGASTAGSAAYMWEQSSKPKIYRGTNTASSPAYTLEYSSSVLRIYRGANTAASPIAVIEKWDDLPKPMLMLIVILLGE